MAFYFCRAKGCDCKNVSIIHNRGSYTDTISCSLYALFYSRCITELLVACASAVVMVESSIFLISTNMSLIRSNGKVTPGMEEEQCLC